MKKIKSLLALALSLSMCVSLVACGSSADDDDEDKAEKKTPTSSAAAAEKESDEKTESKAEAEESTAESKEDESKSVDESEDDTGASVFTNDINITELEPYISEMAGEDIDTAEGILKDVLNITSTRTEAGPYLDNLMYYEWELPKDTTIGGVHFDDVALTTTDNAVDSFSLGVEYEDKKTANDAIVNSMRYEIFSSQGYNRINDNDIDENPELSEYRGAYTLNCGYAFLSIDMGNDKRVLIQILDIH